jgi:hypothetical protein
MSRGSKLTIEDIQNAAKQKNGKCLSEEYINCKTKLKWKCKKGHIWDARPYSVLAGHWCPFCAGIAPLTLEQMKDLAKNKNGKCLSEEYVDSITKLKWKCNKDGFVWEATPNSIKQGSWCAKCSRKVKRTIQEMKELAIEKGGRCLSEEYANQRTILKWECFKGHIWYAKANSITNGHWCPHCSNVARLDIKTMKNIAEENGGKCLSEKYINNRIKLKWQCFKGHIWEASPEHIRRGCWCHECSNFKNVTIKKMQKIEKNKNGDCLS